MRVVVLGASGNVGTSLLRALLDDERVDTLVGITRRPPRSAFPDVEWQAIDITRDELGPVFRGADVVVHLAWLIQPSRELDHLWAVNVDGTGRVLDAIVEAGVGTLVYASSVGAYSPGPSDRPVDESWPTHGVASSSYSRQKAYVERMMDAFEARHGDVRVARLRPGLVFSRESAEEQRRFFAGAFVPRRLLRPGVLPVFPHLPGVRFQAVHAEDVADAYRRAVLDPAARGAYNVAAEPVLTLKDVAALLGARPVPVPRNVARLGAAATWRLRLHPVSPGWVDLAVRSPVMDTTRVREELGWEPLHDANEAVREVLTGIADASGGPTPTLKSGRDVGDELATGHGRRYSREEDVQVPQ